MGRSRAHHHVPDGLIALRVEREIGGLGRRDLLEVLEHETRVVVLVILAVSRPS